MELLETEIEEKGGAFGWRHVCREIRSGWLAGWSLADAVVEFLDNAKCILIRVGLLLLGKIIDKLFKALVSKIFWSIILMQNTTSYAPDFLIVVFII